ncbi:hypothetical protein EMQ25_03925 [Arsenicitalea aurantiaca]|uniref:Uncharacterized protein n=1 Tax=Arsenicitalea aurantiaca TaxID=1783274 RepID=A0A433XMB3_9HYPH|nr:hypothetical protein EMQ25_03925 [Arsenicitalea aurantiaca]
MAQDAHGTCDECGSAFLKARSVMDGLCPECAHWLYGKPACRHEMVGGRCRHCHWDGSVSPFVAGLKPA